MAFSLWFWYENLIYYHKHSFVSSIFFLICFVAFETTKYNFDSHFYDSEFSKDFSRPRYAVFQPINSMVVLSSFYQISVQTNPGLVHLDTFVE